MKKELHTLDEADAIWTAAARRGYNALEGSLSQSSQISPSHLLHETSALTR